jgi:D-alanyl-D-alanine carboxypeptidase-like protein
VSIEAAIARIQAIESAFVPPQPPPQTAPTPAPGGSSFASTLQSAMGTAPAGQAGATPDTAFPKAAPGQYPHLTGDLDAAPELLSRLEALAARRGETFNVTSGLRTIAEQQRLWDNRASNPYPVARPGTSRHQEGRAADVTIGGRAIQDVIGAAELRAAGLAPLSGDAVHVELPG